MNLIAMKLKCVAELVCTGDQVAMNWVAIRNTLVWMNSMIYAQKLSMVSIFATTMKCLVSSISDQMILVMTVDTN